RKYVVTFLLQLRGDVGSDQSGSANNDDLHDLTSCYSVSITTTPSCLLTGLNSRTGSQANVASIAALPMIGPLPLGLPGRLGFCRTTRRRRRERPHDAASHRRVASNRNHERRSASSIQISIRLAVATSRPSSQRSCVSRM